MAMVIRNTIFVAALFLMTFLNQPNHNAAVMA